MFLLQIQSLGPAHSNSPAGIDTSLDHSTRAKFQGSASCHRQSFVEFSTPRTQHKMKVRLQPMWKNPVACRGMHQIDIAKLGLGQKWPQVPIQLRQTGTLGLGFG